MIKISVFHGITFSCTAQSLKSCINSRKNARYVFESRDYAPLQLASGCCCDDDPHREPGAADVGRAAIPYLGIRRRHAKCSAYRRADSQPMMCSARRRDSMPRNAHLEFLSLLVSGRVIKLKTSDLLLKSCDSVTAYAFHEDALAASQLSRRSPKTGSVASHLRLVIRKNARGMGEGIAGDASAGGAGYAHGARPERELRARGHITWSAPGSGGRKQRGRHGRSAAAK